MRFDGKHCVITGGGGEIGLALAQEFAREGAGITLVDRQFSEEARDLAAGMNARLCEADVTDPGALGAAISSLPGIDVAIANAGVHRGGRALDLAPEDWRLMIDVNLTGVFVFCQMVARRMVDGGAGGAILVTGSWVQDVPNIDNTGYCASKAGAAMVARCMALELGEHRIRVNVIAPGIVDAGMAKRQIRIDPVFALKAKRGIPLGELQRADQIARAAMFLCSDEAESITGVTLQVDGGLSLFKYD